MKKKNITAILMVSLMTFSCGIKVSNGASSESLIGDSRWETAVVISKKGWTRAENVVIVNDTSLVDALSATPFAYAKNAPILLTGSDKLNDSTKEEIKRLKSDNVYIIGGKLAISYDVEKELKELNVDVERIYGDDRYETSLAIADELDDIKDVSQIAVVNGEDGIADAVSVSAPAAINHMPIILAHPQHGTEKSDKFIKYESIKKSYVIGGTSILSSEIEKELPNPYRLGGLNRNDTNAKVIKEFYPDLDYRYAYIAKDGSVKTDQLIDALAVGTLAAKTKSPVILGAKELTDLQKSLLSTKNFLGVVQVGGNGNEEVFEQVKKIQKTTLHKVDTVKGLEDAIKNADANDIIEFNPTKAITTKIDIKTDKLITIEFGEGKYNSSVNVDAMNGEFINHGDIKELNIIDLKPETLENYGFITTLNVSDTNGCEILNKADGEIDKINIKSICEDVYLKNIGLIGEINNNGIGTKIVNNGGITKVTGTRTPILEGNPVGDITLPVVDVVREDDTTIKVNFSKAMDRLDFELLLNGKSVEIDDIEYTVNKESYILTVPKMYQGETYTLNIKKTGYEKYTKTITSGLTFDAYMTSSTENGEYTLDKNITLESALKLGSNKVINLNGKTIVIKDKLDFSIYKITTKGEGTVVFDTSSSILGDGFSGDGVFIVNTNKQAIFAGIDSTKYEWGQDKDKNDILVKMRTPSGNNQNN